jgi:hypothetical protein
MLCRHHRRCACCCNIYIVQCTFECTWHAHTTHTVVSAKITFYVTWCSWLMWRSHLNHLLHNLLNWHLLLNLHQTESATKVSGQECCSNHRRLLGLNDTVLHCTALRLPCTAATILIPRARSCITKDVVFIMAGAYLNNLLHHLLHWHLQ